MSALSTELKRQYKEGIKGSPAGEGTRFKALTGVLKKRGARNPKALAAWIGRKKYGGAQMAKWAAAGKKRQ